MFTYYRLKNGHDWLKEIEARANLSIFEYQALSQPLAYAPQERVIDNNLYGYAYNLKKYAGIKHDLKGYMEHGLFLGGIVHPDQKHWHYSRIITLSQMRVNEILHHLPQKKPVAVGPYIHYAQSVLGAEKQSTLKRELGRVLLVFPFHSVKNVGAEFDDRSFIDEINRVKSGFDSVLVSLYFLDAQNPKRVSLYEDEGFLVVTAGHKFDPNFVNRQRTHITLADMTMSNGLGTHVGYCIYLNRPHYIFQQEVKHNAANTTELKRIDMLSNDAQKHEIARQQQLFARLFSHFEEKITGEQREITGQYWGFSDVKTADELREIFV